MFLLKHPKANNPSWIRAHYKQYLKSFHWELTRRLYSLIPLLGSRCYICGSRGSRGAGRGALELHHRTYCRVGRERPGDLVMLCGVCHKRTHWLAARTDDLFQAHRLVKHSNWGRKRRQSRR